MHFEDQPGRERIIQQTEEQNAEVPMPRRCILVPLEQVAIINGKLFSSQLSFEPLSFCYSCQGQFLVKHLSRPMQPMAALDWRCKTCLAEADGDGDDDGDSCHDRLRS